jgi:hypothetical protein
MAQHPCSKHHGNGEILPIAALQWVMSPGSLSRWLPSQQGRNQFIVGTRLPLAVVGSSESVCSLGDLFPAAHEKRTKTDNFLNTVGD